MFSPETPTVFVGVMGNIHSLPSEVKERDIKAGDGGSGKQNTRCHPSFGTAEAVYELLSSRTLLDVSAQVHVWVVTFLSEQVSRPPGIWPGFLICSVSYFSNFCIASI